MLKRFENDATSIQHGDVEGEEEAAVLTALTQALRYAESREEQANIQLAIELRKHLAEERYEYLQEREALETKWQRARDSHQRSTESLQRDTQRASQPNGSGRLINAVKGKTVRDAKQSADFSRMMLRGAETKVIQASEDLKALDARFEKALKRREVEFRLAFVASGEAPQTQFRIQRRIPREYLPENINAPLLVAGSSDSKVKHFVVSQLRTCISGALKIAIPSIDSVNIVEGMEGFGADAYLVVKNKEHKEILRLPISTVATFSSLYNKPRGAQMNANQQTMRKSLLTSCNPYVAESAVKRVVQLISTETMACNAGLLVSAEGILLVRRTTVQAALVSKLAAFAGDSSACHPVAVVVWFVAGLLEKIKRQGDTPRKVLDPPLLY
ncbi:hypothetical protein LPJ74_005193 [Coemansia sp. RSA 1843]|nr:hypothetical protein LPJ74_005193 [Coemansia sp. RSA 1843]